MWLTILLLAAFLLGGLGVLSACWLCRGNGHSAERYRRVLASACIARPARQDAATPQDAGHARPVTGQRKVPGDTTPCAAVDTQPLTGAPAEPAVAQEENTPRPGRPSYLPAAAATIWNRSGDLLTEDCDQTAFRRQVQQRIAHWKRGGPGFTVMLVQVDGCDQLLKTHGPNAVELALRATRLFLSTGLREMDVFDRYRQDCFAVLLPDTGLDNAALVAQRVRHNATQCLLPTRRGPLEVTRSLGLAEVCPSDDQASLLGRAEAALKSAASNRICCHDGDSPRLLPAAAAESPAAESERSSAAEAGLLPEAFQTRT